MKYRTKPAVIEAVQFDFERWHMGIIYYGETISPNKSTNTKAIIETPDGDMEVSDGDYIIIDAQGEHHLCKPDVFEETYELATE